MARHDGNGKAAADEGFDQVGKGVDGALLGSLDKDHEGASFGTLDIQLSADKMAHDHDRTTVALPGELASIGNMAGRGETDGGREGIEADETQGDGKGGGVAAGLDGALGLHVDGVNVGGPDASGPEEAAWALWDADRGETKGPHSLGQLSDVAGLVPGVVLGAFAAGAEAGGLA